MADGEFNISMVLTGPPRLRGRFASYGARLSDEYQAMLTEITEWYSGEIRQRFAESHGQSGETAESIEYSPRLVSRDVYVMDVRIGGHVGFVINPLPNHMETAINAAALGNFDPTGAAVGRGRNFYSEFGLAWNLEWKQGDSDESHSPDTEWYTGEDSALLARASRDLHKLAGFVQLAFADATSGSEVYARATARMQYTYLRNR